ncbi:MAG TPA: hypothetical protein VJ998_00800 [Pseudomonadales bacterium]|nr:hypothetical protein [Pseudomonadales bacterium]
MQYLLAGTRKGAWIYTSDASRGKWKVDGPHYLGSIVNHLVLDPRDQRTMVMALRAGHLVPTILTSTDFGKTWQESPKPPAFPKADDPEMGRSVSHTFWLSPGHESEPGVWWAGTSPPALFRSEDGGVTWDAVKGWNEHPRYHDWCPNAPTPDGELLAQISICTDDPKHMYLCTSSGGVFETTDQCATWAPLNKGVEVTFGPELYPEFGQDAHQIAVHPKDSNRIYQQNHCGIYRIDRPGDTWVRIGNNMPEAVGDIGFSVVVDPRNTDKAWVWPMDGSDVWPRTSPGGKPAAYMTDDGGETWQRQDKGFPREQAWYTVKRQAFVGDGLDPMGLYIGTTGGEVWASSNAGESWNQIAVHLPEIYSLNAVTVD